MGTLVRVVIETRERDRADHALRAAFGRLRELDAALSDYKPDSELNRLCRAGRAQVSLDLFRNIEAAQSLAVATNGAFDITIGDRTRSSTFRDVELDSKSRTVTLRKPNMKLDLGAIGKGYAGDEMLRVLRAHGCPHSMVALSGDIVVGEGAWNVMIEAAQQTFKLKNAAVSTAGDTGRRHIRDARTGELVEQVWLVSVLARTGLEADGLDTALRIIGEEEGRKLAAARHVKAWFRRVA